MNVPLAVVEAAVGARGPGPGGENGGGVREGGFNTLIHLNVLKGEDLPNPLNLFKINVLLGLPPSYNTS